MKTEESYEGDYLVVILECGHRLNLQVRWLADTRTNYSRQYLEGNMACITCQKRNKDTCMCGGNGNSGIHLTDCPSHNESTCAACHKKE